MKKLYDDGYGIKIAEKYGEQTDFGNSNVTYGSGYPSGGPTYSGSDGGFHGGAYAGARWYFNSSWAVFSELGWNISIFTIGGTFKF